ncbi:putative malate dehydrogenase (decarboxylating) [Medicago truncatula]|uniref:Putative malate dehydrogenase (Decarboxylating) n=1 Tax=Medicago truncatula TaxID=3880 RepID=A0A396JKB2_MEDTR|nr:putative malate dehydrogenase (decarboxylating) [Medicago truncatula]
MSSAQQNFNQGQSHGQTQAKAEEWIQSTKDSASAASDRAHSAANTAGQTAKDSASAASDGAHSASNTTGQTARDSASAAADRANAAANTTGQESERNKEEAAGFLQQTGEQVKNMAQGAVESVKHTLGMDNSSNANAANTNAANTTTANK